MTAACVLVALPWLAGRADAEEHRPSDRGRVREMITCDALAKGPIVVAGAGLGARSLAGAAAGGDTDLLRSPREGRLVLAALGVAAAGHAFCGPATFAGHREYGRALTSLGLRLALPAAALAATWAARDGRAAIRSSPADVAGGSVFAATIVGGWTVDYVITLW